MNCTDRNILVNFLQEVCNLSSLGSKHFGHLDPDPSSVKTKASIRCLPKSKIGKLINKSKSCNLPIHAENQQNGTESNLDNGRKQS